MENVLSDSESGSSIIDDQRIWRKNCRMFYSLLISERLQWPSLSVEWLNFSGHEKHDYSTHRLALATHTSSQEPEKLIVTSVKLPFDNISAKQIENINSNGIYSTVVSMNHQGESNRIRVHPQNNFLIASKSSNGKIYLYDYTHVKKDEFNKGCEAVFEGHTEEGYGLCWNSQYLLASGSYDKMVYYWDVARKAAQPTGRFGEHEDLVEDVAWVDDCSIITVGDDKKIVISDIRSGQSQIIRNAHQGIINSVDVNKSFPMLVLTGGSDKCALVWDLRKTLEPLRSLQCSNEVLSSKWSPNVSSYFATSGTDNKINIWNLGKENSLIFTHEGHFNTVNEFSWHPSEVMTLASVDEDNYLQVWCMHPEYLN